MPITFAKLGKYGRIGNQLWQCSATIAHAIRHKCDYILPHWEYENDFNIPKNKFTDLKNIKYSKTFDEPHFHYAGIPYWPNMNLMGYYQSYKYWQDYSNIIKQLLTPKYKATKYDGTSIHVRRTDYLVHAGCYNILDMKNYYEKAMEIVGGNKFLIFSDDIQWCKQHFIGNQFEFAEGNTIQDFSTMINCINNICANSSYSWWSSYLNPNPNKKVVAPAIWFGPKLAPTHDIKDLLLNEWVKV